MKNVYPTITASTCAAEDEESNEATEPVIRLKLDKPLNWEWELTTSADTVPVIQLLDKNGRLLVETTGRTAQRARGSFREGLKSYEEFPPGGQSAERTPTASSSFSSPSIPNSPVPAQGNRNIDGFSTKFGSCDFGYRPRKSKSDVSVKEREARGKKRLSGGPDPTQTLTPQGKTTGKRYSLGDYLRQQIIDDLRTRSTFGKCPEEIAQERCKKMKAYLRTQSENLPRLFHVEEEAGERTESTLTEEEARDRRIKDGLKRLREAVREEDRDEGATVRRSGTEPMGFQSSIGNEELRKVKAFLQRKLQQKMDQERAAGSSTCEGAQEAGNAIRKRYSDYRQNEKPRGYRARKVRSETNIVRFEANPETPRTDKQTASRQPERERSRSRNGRARCEDPMKQTVCQRSISDAALNAVANHRAKVQTRDSSGSEKRKLYRKTKSDVLFGRAGSSLESEQDLENPPRRIRSQDNVDESWRGYRERRKLGKPHRDSEKEANEEDFMSKPRWKDLQSESCSFRDCRVCQNSRDCVNPVEIPQDRPTTDRTPTLNDLPGDRPGTSLQENYLVIDRDATDRPINPTIARIRVEDREVRSCNANSPDCGYNTIPKEAFKDYRELYMRSNVKKSDTFKIVDGSEDPEQAEDATDSKVDEGSLDSFGCPNAEGLLTNKSNEDIARDYFKRVYELLKKRQEEARRVQDRLEMPGCDDSSSSNYAEKVQKKRPRRRKKERNGQGKENELFFLLL